MKKPDSDVVAARRKNLAHIIAEKYAGIQASLLSDVQTRHNVELNQGELSGLLSTKSFGEKKARSLEKLLGIPSGALDAPVSSSFQVATMPAPVKQVVDRLASRVASEKDLRLLVQLILDEKPTEIPVHIQDSVKSMIQTMRNLIQQSIQKK